MNRVNRTCTIKNTIIDYSKCIGVNIMIVMFIKIFIFEPTLINGESMMPTLNHNDRLIIGKIPYNLKLKEFNRGDVIIFKAPDKDVHYVKRIIGLPGDTVKIQDGYVYVNEKLIKENYIKKDTYTHTENEGESVVVKDGCFFVLGDNRDPGASKDSRVLGSISKDSVEGKAEIRFFPFNDLKKF